MGRLIAPDFLPIGPQELSIRAGDRLPSLVAEIIDDQGRPVALSGGDRVFLSTRRLTGVPVVGNDWQVAREVLIIDRPDARWYYDFQSYDTDTNPGLFELVVLIKFANGTELTAPTRSNCRVHVRDKVRPVIGEAYLRTKDDDVITTKGDVPLVVKLGEGAAFQPLAFKVPEGPVTAPLFD